ncbi:FecR domain-containing protein [Pedobacter sp. KR3-3]|uniref:FecR domain-containing protein n=1 Tax=Pedobacter albus TaxID=3113905 RepID=A0ABU7I4P8_9SPHI|nr:FecR domain-containing protein [Pedobacter sp. KR3-3]MEE1944374.1 FecR domain-containing protein [Pedobacter sp. KR3-3]
MEEHYYQLIEHYFNKSINAEELHQLKSWVESNEANQHKFREVLRIFEATEMYLQQPTGQAKSWALVANHISQNSANEEPKPKIKKLGSWHRYAMAAVLVMVCGLGLLLFKSDGAKTKPQAIVKVISNPNGEQRSITMPDGSVVYLNAGSRISYNAHFSADKREVKLEGEAFFDVVHETKRPFIVKTGKVSTTVLGTSFNIKAFPAKAVEVTVETGKVGVVLQRANKKDTLNFLLPNEQLLIDTTTEKIVKQSINATAVSGWKQYKLAFYNTSMQDIAASIERTYDVKISFKQPQTAQLKLTAKFDKCGIKQVMDVLSRLSGSTYQINGNKITIY